MINILHNSPNCNIIYNFFSFPQILKIDLNNISCPKVQQLLASANSGISVFDNLGIRLPYVLVGPAVAIVSALILWDYLGPTFLVSLVFVAVMIPAQGKDQF